MTPFAKENRVTSIFGYREFYLNGKLVKGQHNGIDKVVNNPVVEEDWNVRSVTNGAVKDALVGYNGGRGNLVKVEPEPGIIVIYQHLKSIAVKKGQTVKQGDVIGVAGNTGDSTGRHLHTEVQVNGKAVDPSPWIGVPNKLGVYPGNNDLDADGPMADGTEDKQYTATPLVDGLRLRPYPVADDSNCNEALAFLEKGHAYPLVQTRDHWAYLLTEGNAGGWACIDDENGTYLDIREV